MNLKSWRNPLRAEISPPGDKSITHRAILFSSLVREPMVITGWLDAQDTRSSLGLVQAIGTEILEARPDRLVLKGPGIDALREPGDVIDCGNSGTTMRLATGLLSAISGMSVLTGDESLRRRPMRRVVVPMQELGVRVWTRQEGFAPIAVSGGAHAGGTITVPVASAQVKSALLLAGLSAAEPVRVIEPKPTRDHTERLLEAMGAQFLRRSEGDVQVGPGSLRAVNVDVPGDPSAAAFWAALAALIPGSELVIRQISLNPGRVGFYRVLERMGAQVEWQVTQENPEPIGDMVVRPGPLSNVTIDDREVPDLIDELPLVVLLASLAPGLSTIRGAKELRVKESDRIHATVEGLTRMGAMIEELPDGFRIEGVASLHGADVDAAQDHRIAMMLTVASAVADGMTHLTGSESVAISYPEFYRQYEKFQGGNG